MKDKVYVDREIPRWKANFHIHSTRSDGRQEIGDRIVAYREAGYNIIMPSDHNIMWNTDEYDEENFITMRGSEVSPTNRYDNQRFNAGGLWRVCHHLLAIWDERLDRPCPYAHDERLNKLISPGITSWNEYTRFWREQGFYMIYCHPRWSKASAEHLMAMEYCQTVEVYNHECRIATCTGYSEVEWDYCLSNNKRFYCCATDDSHRFVPLPKPELSGGFTMIQAPVLSRVAVSEALDRGDFYASEGGPQILDLRVQGGRIQLQCTPAREVRFVSEPVYHREITAREQGVDAIIELEMEIKPKTLFIRLELIGFDGAKTWSQPIFPDDLLRDNELGD
ncbi:MAG: hypothetical protein GX907_02130 [Clostridiaceae bacterium]|mgnify:FL=1|nr:hypothetical protein [Clostridiaceae bacterium]